MTDKFKNIVLLISLSAIYGLTGIVITNNIIETVSNKNIITNNKINRFSVYLDRRSEELTTLMSIYNNLENNNMDDKEYLYKNLRTMSSLENTYESKPAKIKNNIEILEKYESIVLQYDNLNGFISNISN